MQKAEVILSLLSQKGKNNAQYVFRRLYRNLFNPDFYLRAYTALCDQLKHDIDTSENYNAIIEEIILEMRKETYFPSLMKEPTLAKQKKVPLQQLPALKDLLVQEVVRQILEAIYEPIFLNTSHGDRQNRSHHTALSMIQATCSGTTWVIDGRIKDFYHQLDPQILFQLLEKKIDDGRFIELIRRFIKRGYLKGQSSPFPILERPLQRSIATILGNIYLHELDQFMAEWISQYSKKHSNHSLNGQESEKNIRVEYIRYLDHFLVFIAGSKNDSIRILDQIRTFLKKELKLELDEEKKPLIHLKDQKVQFLGYEIALNKSSSNRQLLQLLVPQSVIQEKIKPFSQAGKPIHKNSRINWSLYALLKHYNQEIQELYQYYCLATDVRAKVGKFRYYHYLSLLKTVARKEKCSVKKVLTKYGVSIGKGNKRVFGIIYKTSDGKRRVITYFSEPLKRRNYIGYPQFR